MRERRAFGRAALIRSRADTGEGRRPRSFVISGLLSARQHLHAQFAAFLGEIQAGNCFSVSDMVE